jgi:hypothetical protein
MKMCPNCANQVQDDLAFCPGCGEYFQKSKSRQRSQVIIQEELRRLRIGILFCFVLSFIVLGFCTGFGLALEIYILAWVGIGLALLFFGIGIYYMTRVENLRERKKRL